MTYNPDCTCETCRRLTDTLKEIGGRPEVFPGRPLIFTDDLADLLLALLLPGPAEHQDPPTRKPD